MKRYSSQITRTFAKTKKKRWRIPNIFHSRNKIGLFVVNLKRALGEAQGTPYLGKAGYIQQEPCKTEIDGNKFNKNGDYTSNTNRGNINNNTKSNSNGNNNSNNNNNINNNNNNNNKNMELRNKLVEVFTKTLQSVFG